MAPRRCFARSRPISSSWLRCSKAIRSVAVVVSTYGPGACWPYGVRYGEDDGDEDHEDRWLHVAPWTRGKATGIWSCS